MKQLLIYYVGILLFVVGGDFSLISQADDMLDWVEVNADKTHFVKKGTNKTILFWGANYDHDSKMRLIDDYWLDEWDTIVNDFDEMKSLSLNIVRIHLQLGRFMDSPSQPNSQALKQLSKLIKIAETRKLYLYITGLACYKKSNIPDWYDVLNESDRWTVQATFWKHVAKTCKSSPAVFCFDLMNEPVIPTKQTNDWLTPEGLENLFFVQKITKTPNGRTPHVIAKAWIDCLVTAIRSEDQCHLITVGVIPWAMVWSNAKPQFYDPVVAKNLDFVSVHFYPESQKIEKAIQALKVYAIGKPIIIAEMFPLKCSVKEMDRFIDDSKSIAQGWLSFYWGKTIDEYSQIKSPKINDLITKEWLNYFKSKHDDILKNKFKNKDSR